VNVSRPPVTHLTAESSAPNAALLGDSSLQSEVLEDLAAAANYREWLVGLVHAWLASPCIEIGSGLGLYAQELSDRGLQLTATEADHGRLAALRARFAQSDSVRVEELTVPVDRKGDYASLVSFNVLEHIVDDVSALRAFAGLCQPGATIVAVVPAFPIGMSRFDREIGHVRRYRKRTLQASVEAAGLEGIELRHVNSLGLIAWVLLVRLGHGRPRHGLGLRVFDGVIVPMLARLERRHEPPFGQSLILRARVPRERVSAASDSLSARRSAQDAG